MGKKRSSSSKRPVGRPPKANTQKRGTQNEHYQLWAVVLFGIALVLGILTFFEGENFWSFLHKMYFGIFGAASYLIAPLCLIISILLACEQSLQSVKSKVLEGATLLFLISGALHIFMNVEPQGENFFIRLADLYINGTEIRGGGLSGAVFGWSLWALFGKSVASIIIIIVTIIFLMIVLGITLKDVFSAFKKPVKQLGQDYQEHLEHRQTENDEEKSEAVYIDNSKGSDIDIPLGPDAVNKSDRSPNTIEEEENLPQTKKAKLKRAKSKLLDEEPIDIDIPEADEEEEKPTLKIDDIIEKSKEEEKDTTPLELTEDKDGQTMLYSDGATEKVYKYPPLTLLKAPKPQRQSDGENEIRQNAETLMGTLSSFGVKTRLLGATRGPAVTRYELQPSAGVRISRITQLADDIALNLAATKVRIEAPIPNKAAVGIEVPNSIINSVTLREVLSSQTFRDSDSNLEVALGKDISGSIVTTDIAKMPHLLIAGTTGSGKSVCTNSMILSIIYRSSPADVKLLLIDPKMVEFSMYNGIPHLLVPVVTDPKKAAGALSWAVSEMDHRYTLFAQYNVKDIHSFNAMAEKTEGVSKLPQIVIIIDEFADLMMMSKNDVETAVCRIAQKARAAGMHLIIATQRPSVDVITGLIKANISSRIALTVSSQTDSRTIIDGSGAESLLGRGDMLFKPYGSDKITRIQGCFVSEKEIKDVVSYIKNSDGAEYDQEVMQEIEKQTPKDKSQISSTDNDEISDESDPLIKKAIECVVEHGQASTSLLQRKIKVGYARAARLIDEMEERGIVGEYEGSKPRKVLITRDQWVEMNMRESE